LRIIEQSFAGRRERGLYSQAKSNIKADAMITSAARCFQMITLMLFGQMKRFTHSSVPPYRSRASETGIQTRMQNNDPRLQLIRRALEHLRGLGIETESESECKLAHDAVAALTELEGNILPEPPEGLRYDNFEQVAASNEIVWGLQYSVDGLQHLASGATMREAALAAAEKVVALNA
jgi:hypothetical protein